MTSVYILDEETRRLPSGTHVFVGGDAKAAVVQHFDHGMYMVVFENGRPAQ